jgi:hypothetical protein
LNATHNGGKPVASVEALLLAFEPLLALDVISQIRKTLDALKHFILGVEIVFLPSLNSILENIVLDLKERAYASLPLPTVNYNDGRQQIPLQRQVNRGRGDQRGSIRRDIVGNRQQSQ